MLRFVVLDHNWPSPHKDLLLERNGTLESWRLPFDFTLAEAIFVEPRPDHRIIYLDYEGPISGDRGSVQMWDRGELIWLEHEERIRCVQFFGRILQGQWALGWVKEDQWIFRRLN